MIAAVWLMLSGLMYSLQLQSGSFPKPLTKEEEQRREITFNTYLTAKERGDENVYFIDNRKLMEIIGDNGTVDGCHPTDSGYFSMACAIKEVFEKIFFYS